MRKTIFMLAALLVTAVPTLISKAQQTVNVEPGRYEIEVTLTGKVLDLKKEDMRSVQQYFRGKVNNQQWDIQNAEG
ncbi:MAG: RICIN domain-containing protein, partial [Leptolyngbyaceae cyanobacterium CAN_BIN12]|nr:RICIN domain-containing protein [Leptolyngbyaceae cyanobacterium CAN_BIN12]